MNERLQITPTRLWVNDTNGKTVKTPVSQKRADPPSNVRNEILADFDLPEKVTPIIPTARDRSVGDRSTSNHRPTNMQRSPVTPSVDKQVTPIHTSEKSASSEKRISSTNSEKSIPKEKAVQTIQNVQSAATRIEQSVPSATKVEQSVPSTQHIKYSNEEINEMLSNGYLYITKELWEFLPAGSHVRFFKKGPGTKNERFRPGGFIKKHYITSEGKRVLLMETIRGGTTAVSGYITYPMMLDDLEEIWKRYPEECFVEIHLIHNSLVNKNKLIADLSNRLTALEARLTKAGK